MASAFLSFALVLVAFSVTVTVLSSAALSAADSRYGDGRA